MENGTQPGPKSEKRTPFFKEEKRSYGIIRWIYQPGAMPEIRSALGEREPTRVGTESREQAVFGRSGHESAFGHSGGDQTPSQRRHNHKGFNLAISPNGTSQVCLNLPDLTNTPTGEALRL